MRLVHSRTENLSVAVLMGGQSAEADVSVNSAIQIEAALREVGYKVKLLELNGDCVRKLQEMKPDVVFPALHGPPGEDGTVQGMLEMLGLPYVGSDVRGSAMAMDKGVAKLLFRRHSLPVSDEVVIHPDDNLAAALSKVLKGTGDRVAIKPLNQGSAIGVQLYPNGGDIEAGILATSVYGACMVEPFIAGREMTVGVLHLEEDFIAHPVIEIRTPDDEWYDYKNRYTKGKSEHIVPAPISAELTKQLQDIAVRAHQALGLRDFSRADFIVNDDDEVFLLEVNTLPGMTPLSLYPEGALSIGYTFSQLVETLVNIAYQRGQL